MQTFLTILNNWTTTAKSVLIARIWCIARRCIKKLNEIRRIRPVSFCDKYGISALVIKPANCRYNKVNNHYFLNGNSNWKLLKLLTSCVRLFEYVSNITICKCIVIRNSCKAPSIVVTWEYILVEKNKKQNLTEMHEFYWLASVM